jgi:hypothetical protein
MRTYIFIKFTLLNSLYTNIKFISRSLYTCSRIHYRYTLWSSLSTTINMQILSLSFMKLYLLIGFIGVVNYLFFFLTLGLGIFGLWFLTLFSFLLRHLRIWCLKWSSRHILVYWWLFPHRRSVLRLLRGFSFV